jgi:hypothetical protein
MKASWYQSFPELEDPKIWAVSLSGPLLELYPGLRDPERGKYSGYLSSQSPKERNKKIACFRKFFQSYSFPMNPDQFLCQVQLMIRN